MRRSRRFRNMASRRGLFWVWQSQAALWACWSFPRCGELKTASRLCERLLGHVDKSRFGGDEDLGPFGSGVRSATCLGDARQVGCFLKVSLCGLPASILGCASVFGLSSRPGTTPFWSLNSSTLMLRTIKPPSQHGVATKGGYRQRPSCHSC